MSICKRCGKDVGGIHTCTPPKVYKTTGQRIVEKWAYEVGARAWSPEGNDLADLSRRIDQALETANAEVERLTKDRDALVKSLELVNERLLKGLKALVEKEAP